MRVRLVYEKRGAACFVPHIALAQIFSRSALRAGFELIMTQGFTPRAKLSFGPELPAGVVALNEPVDMYINGVSRTPLFFPPKLGGIEGGIVIPKDDIRDRMNASLPDGFRVSRVLFPNEDAPNLGKFCTYAEYFLRCAHDLEALSYHVYGDAVIHTHITDGWLRLILSSPAQNPIGRLVKHMINENIIAGWHEINIVRAAVGGYSNGEVALWT